MSILQWNIRGYSGNLPDLKLLISEYNPVCVCLQETKLKYQSGRVLRGYSFVESPNKYNGDPSNTAILVRNDVPFKDLNFRSEIRFTAVQIFCRKWFTVCSVYLPPNTPFDVVCHNDFINRLTEPYIILGDFNGRHTLWHDEINNTRGRIIETFLFPLPISILNTSGPTHIDARTKTESCIDLSLCSNSIALDFSWKLDDDLHNSDHFPIVVNLNDHHDYERPKKWNINTADWSLFCKLSSPKYSTDSFEDLNDLVSYFTSIIFNAASASIHRSSGRINKKCVPWWNAECKQVIKIKRQAWTKYRRQKNDVNFIDFKRASAVARKTIRKAQKESWRMYVSTINEQTPINSIWKKIHKIAGKYIPDKAIVLHQQGNIIADPKEVAQSLATHFCSISEGKHLSKEFLTQKRIQEQVALDFSTDLHESYNDTFSMKELSSALSKCKSTAEGPDDIHYDMVKHLSKESQHYLLQIYNRIWTSHQFPDWRKAFILAFRKPGKSGNEPGHYRPIALTSCLCKIFEKMVNARLQWFLESKGCLSPFQYGFRKKRSTTDALVALEIYIREAFASNKFVTAVFFDIEKAYDTTWRYHILKELHSFGLRGNMPICVQNFFKDRTFQVRVGNTYSSVHNQYEGVPQGSVLSTTCFIVAMNNIGHSLPQGVRSSIFVDDYLISIAGNNKREVQNILQTAIDNITKWAENCGFKFSSSKTCAVTFTRQHLVPQPLLKLYKEPIQYKNSTKFLGMIFDTRLTWEPHIEHLKIECTKTLNMIKVLSHTSWGADRKTLLMLHNSLILSKIDYGCQIYASATTTKLSKLNPIHNAGLRLSTGAFKSTPIKSLYAETGFYSLEYRRIKICLRYYMRTSTRYSPFLDRIIKNTSYLATYENHPRYLRPFNIRISSLLEDFNLNPNLDTRNCSKMVPWRMPDIKFCKELTSVKKSEVPDYHLCKLFYEHFN